MHPDIAIELARLRVAEQRERAVHRRALPPTRHPRGVPALRIRLGRALVRWGQRLASPPATARSACRTATMGT